MKNFQNFLYEAESPIRRESNIDLSRAKVGDLIICKDNRGVMTLSKERIYKIEKLDRENRIGFIDNEGELHYTYYNRFDWVDKPEDNDYEEWVQEEYNVSSFKYGDKVRIISTGQEGVVDLVPHRDNPKKLIIVSGYWKGWNFTKRVSSDDLEFISDKPEESNMEEWMEEGFKIPSFKNFKNINY